MKFMTILLATSLLTFSAWASNPVNINTASAEELAESLKGVGMSKAELIVQYRETNGVFTHVDELVNVKGIGISTVDKNRGQILLSDAPAESKD
jgi:competence protein ComEA